MSKKIPAKLTPLFDILTRTNGEIAKWSSEGYKGMMPTSTLHTLAELHEELTIFFSRKTPL